MYDYFLYFILLFARNISILTFYNEWRRRAAGGIEHKATIIFVFVLRYGLDRELSH
jgi:hypothetical protein